MPPCQSLPAVPDIAVRPPSVQSRLAGLAVLQWLVAEAGKWRECKLTRQVGVQPSAACCTCLAAIAALIRLPATSPTLTLSDHSTTVVQTGRAESNSPSTLLVPPLCGEPCWRTATLLITSQSRFPRVSLWRPAQ